MRIDILTLFPNMFTGFLSESIMKRALDNKLLEVNLIDFREFSDSKHKKVDDYPFGGGAGMVLNVQPVVDALRSIEGYESALKIMMSPQGCTLNQNKAYHLSTLDHLIILCGHYEGYDERIRDYFDIEISIGDYVLTGGELGAMVLIDSVSRLISGVLNKDESHENDSFSHHLLEHPHYTRPREFEGKTVPEVLVNGNHKLIDEWRLNESIKKTKERRPDLYKKYLKGGPNETENC
jgi:tRNA (guanine37-N1)-methyltransferase